MMSGAVSSGKSDSTEERKKEGRDESDRNGGQSVKSESKSLKGRSDLL